MGAKETYKKDFDYGFDSEEKFISECRKMGLECKKTSEEVDMKDHIDWIITKNGKNYTIDIKGAKKIQRSDQGIQEDFHWVELVNVNGDPGWLYGNAQMFAFETFSSWIIVLRQNLQKWVEENVTDEVVERGINAVKKKYTREKFGRKDVLTLVKSLDLVSISSSIIKKTIK